MSGDDATAWLLVAILAAFLAVVLAGLAASFSGALGWAAEAARRRRKTQDDVEDRTPTLISEAWRDPEVGGGKSNGHGKGHPNGHGDGSAKPRYAAGSALRRLDSGSSGPLFTKEQLRETLKDILAGELSDGLRVRLAERFDRWEDGQLVCGGDALAKESAGPRAAADGAGPAAVAADVGVRPVAIGFKDALRMSLADTKTPNSSDRSGASSLPPAPPTPQAPPQPPEEPPAPQEPPPRQQAPLAPPLAPPLPPPMAPGTPRPAGRPARPPPIERPVLEFGPTPRQQELPEPPEKCEPGAEQEACVQTSLQTVRRALSRRQAQAVELQRQLRDARQELRVQSEAARDATCRLQALQRDSSQAPQARAVAVAQLEGEVQDLSGRLADARAAEARWAAVSRQQRAYFLQCEHLGQEGVQAARHHPAGDVFLVPPPATTAQLEEEDLTGGHEHAGAGWDVGTSHCNPYKVDSWPFEPNVLAQRAAKEPNLQQLPELEERPQGAEESEEPSEEGEGFTDLEEDHDDEDDGPWGKAAALAGIGGAAPPPPAPAAAAERGRLPPVAAPRAQPPSLAPLRQGGSETARSL